MRISGLPSTMPVCGRTCCSGNRADCQLLLYSHEVGLIYLCSACVKSNGPFIHSRVVPEVAALGITCALCRKGSPRCLSRLPGSYLAIGRFLYAFFDCSLKACDSSLLASRLIDKFLDQFGLPPEL